MAEYFLYEVEYGGKFHKFMAVDNTPIYNADLKRTTSDQHIFRNSGIRTKTLSGYPNWWSYSFVIFRGDVVVRHYTKIGESGTYSLETSETCRAAYYDSNNTPNVFSTFNNINIAYSDGWYTNSGSGNRQIISYNENYFQELRDVSDTEWDNYIESPYVPPITYTWKSIKSLSLGNMDNYVDWRPYTASNSTLLLSYIPDESAQYIETDTPVINGTNFVLKSPSLEEVMVDFNDTSYTERVLKLSNGNYALVGIQSGLLSHSYRIQFYIGGQQFPQLIYTGTFSTSAGTPYLGFLIDSENQAVKLNIIFSHYLYDSSYGTETHVVDYNTLSLSDNDMSALYTWLNGSSSEDETPDESETNQDQGNDDNDPVQNVALNGLDNPTYGAVASGFVKLYKMTPSQLADLADFMWDASFIENLVRLFSDPRELIVGLSIFPISPLNTETATIRAGNMSTGVSGELLTEEYRTRYAGKVKIPKGKSNFMSFGPYRRIRIFVPYCGEHEIDPSAVYGKTLKLYYHISFFSGTCVAELMRDDEPFMFFGGQIGFQVPISSVDYTRTISSILSAGASIGTAIMTGGGSLLFAGASEASEDDDKKKKNDNPNYGSNVSKVVNSIARGFSPNVTYNSAGGSTTGFLGCQQPFLVFEESIPAFDGSQADFLGVVKKKVMSLNNCKGFTKVLDVHLEGIGCTETEQNDIKRQLSSGVIIRTGSTTPSANNDQLVLLKNLDENNVIGKSWDGTTNTVTWHNLHDQSILNPSFTIDGDCTGYNYVYIPLFKRFYFINDYRLTKENLQELRLEVDSLQSFKDDILNCSAVIDRGTGSNNAFIEDPYKWVQANKEVSTVPFTDGGVPFDFDHQEDCYILAIASGNN